MKIDNLINNLQKNTAEQDRIIKEQAENATNRSIHHENLLTAPPVSHRSRLKNDIPTDRAESLHRTGEENLPTNAACLLSFPA